jgi:prevent-host-death family protein
MEKRISDADANRKFSQLLKGVRAGRSYIVTSHGEPVARMMPASGEREAAKAARDLLLARLRKQRTTQIARWTRDELYDDER